MYYVLYYVSNFNKSSSSCYIECTIHYKLISGSQIYKDFPFSSTWPEVMSV